jgi:hypothetical protein
MSFLMRAAARACREPEEELYSVVLCFLEVLEALILSWFLRMNRGFRSGAITFCCAVSYLVQSTHGVLLLCFQQISSCLQSLEHGLLLNTASHNHNEMLNSVSSASRYIW